MNYIKNIILIVILLLPLGVSGQCLNFAKSSAATSMPPYITDGNFNACEMHEGETAEMYKTFFEGQSYRMVIAKANELPPVYVRVIDKSGRVLFDNKDLNYATKWDFKVNTTQMLVVQLKVLDPKKSTIKTKGCLGILFGLATEKKK